MNVTVRHAVGTDAARIAALLIDTRKAFMPYAPPAHTQADIHDWVASDLLPGGGVFVAQLEGNAVGVLASKRQDRLSWITQMAVDPALVGQGIGSLLLDHALHALEAPVRLYTFQANVRARTFYERRGFVALAYSDGRTNEEKCPDVLYELRALKERHPDVKPRTRSP